jgi:hypothetical protein
MQSGDAPFRRTGMAAMLRQRSADGTFEMMPQMVLLDPAAEPRSRLVGNMGDIVTHS